MRARSLASLAKTRRFGMTHFEGCHAAHPFAPNAIRMGQPASERVSTKKRNPRMRQPPSAAKAGFHFWSTIGTAEAVAFPVCGYLEGEEIRARSLASLVRARGFGMTHFEGCHAARPFAPNAKGWGTPLQLRRRRFTRITTDFAPLMLNYPTQAKTGLEWATAPLENPQGQSPHPVARNATRMGQPAELPHSSQNRA
jgi:hypothetical protein